MNAHARCLKARFLVLIAFFMQAPILASNLDGTTSLVYKNQHHVFSNGESARGFVRMNGGFTIKPAAKATLDTVVTVSGVIDLRETGTMQLISDLKLDYGITWSSGGYINGRGKTLILNGPLTIPASKIIHVTGDTIINGNKNNLILNENTQIVVENNATLTLRNIFVRNVRNNPNSPCIRVSSHSGKLALDNTELTITGDMNFSRGKLYIHNDVIFSGTSALIYTSTQTSYIAPSSTLFFDIGTTFSFAPQSTSNDLFVLQDRSSSLFLNGASLKITSTGMRMTKGNLLLDNKVLLSARDHFTTVTGLTALTSQDYGASGSDIFSLAWNSTGTVLAIGGGSPTNGAGGFANTDELRLYSFNGSTLTALTSQDYGTYIHALAWNPAGTVLAIGGTVPVSGAGGFANTDELRLYSFNGSTLTALTSQDYGNYIHALAWNSAGTVLAIGGASPVNGAGGFANTDDVRLYSFNGSTLTALTSQDYGNFVEALAWNPTGTVLAVGGYLPVNGAGGFANTDELRLYSFNGSTLTALTSQNYGTRIQFLAWNPTGTVLAVGGTGAVNGAGGFANTHDVRLYSFNGSALTALTSQDYGNVRALDWNPAGTILAAGGMLTGNELQLYNFNGSTLTALTSQDYGNIIQTLDWNPAGTVLAIGGTIPVSGAGGFANTHELRLYDVDSYATSLIFAAVNSLIFGNSVLGSSYDLNVEVLGGAHVIVEGNIVDDSA